MTTTLDRSRAAGAPPELDLTFDDLGPRLADVRFVVVDLETTGGSPRDAAITEIGAVRTVGGRPDGEFATLVNPGVEIPPFIAALTGITTAAVAAAPRIGHVLPSFLEFARGSVLVAHNAPFDTGFLRAAAASTGVTWPPFTVLDTARLARVLLHRDEVRDHRLATLARHFRSATVPDHRALTDARATVDVLHGLLERAGDLGAHHLADVVELCRRLRPEQRAKRTLADGLPTGPGVYRFVAPDGRTLYVGKAKSLRARVRSYFTGSETRGRILEMIRIAERVEPIPCATELEAAVREVRLIAADQPPYNRRSRNAERAVWLRLTTDPAPRLSLVTRLPGSPDWAGGLLGPFPSHATGRRAAELLLAAHPLRTCTGRLSPTRPAPACLRADLGTCPAPCRDAAAFVPYAALADTARTSLALDLSPVVAAAHARIAAAVAAERFEEAARVRDDLLLVLRTAEQGRALDMLGRCRHLVAAQAVGREWHIGVVRYGRLAGAAVARPDTDPRQVVEAAVAAAATVPAPAGAVTAATAEESRLILAWLAQPGTRLVHLDGVLAQPLLGIRPALTRLTAAGRRRVVD